jgi:hypothetical protein
MSAELVKQTPKIGEGLAGPGRPKGSVNKATALIKDAIIKAAANAGDGDMAAYLTKQAKENPGPFMALLGKVLPMQVTGIDGGPVQITRIELVAPGYGNQDEEQD